MIKKLLLPFIFMMGVIVLVSCDGQSSTTELQTTTEEETTTVEATTTEQVTTTEEETTTVEATTTDQPTTTEEPTTTIQYVELPNLEDQIENDIVTLLDALDLNYTFKFESDLNLDEGTFLYYGSGYEAGDMINPLENLSVILSTQTIILPNLVGMTDIEIDRYLIRKGINNFDYEIITDNTVEDGTFAGYMDYEVGDTVEPTDEFIIYIGYNSEQLPDLNGLIKRQIVTALEDKNIQYEFSYVVDDDYPEDTFAYYQGHAAGEYYDEVSTIEVVLYKNTFTDSDSSLIISKYGDSDINSIIELYNPTDQAIDLSDYHLVIYENASYEVTYRIDFGDDVLASGDTYLITSTATEPSVQRYADLRTDDLAFDGINDTIQLRYKNGTYIDTIYQIGDRGSEMDNGIFIRRENVVSGNRTFTINQWSMFVPDYYEAIGTHPIEMDPMPRLTQAQIYTLITNGFDHPLGGMDEVEVTTIHDGDTAAFYPGFEGAERVRFIGNDTPETSPTVVDEPEPWGLEAKAFTQTILEYARDNNKPIYIQSDPDIGYTEGYGRHLGLIWVDLGDDVLSIDIKDSAENVLFTEEFTGIILVNYLVVKYGFSADEYASTSTLEINNRYMYSWFDEAQLYAKENHLGIHE